MGVTAPLDFVVTHRVDSFRSGVARFNEILSQHLDVPMYPLFDERLPTQGVALLSFKVSEFSDVECEHLDELLDRSAWTYRCFLHDWTGTEIEERLARGAQTVYCGNHEVYEDVRGLNSNVEILWSPGLILDDRPFHPTAISVFSFGMAHKVRAQKLLRLRELLERSGLSYTVYISSANHETASIKDTHAVFEEVDELFPSRLFFLGNLSDVAIYNCLEHTTFFAAFFEHGVRANNGTVAAAMDHGAVVLTTLDRHSPPDYVHMDNIIDLDQIDELPLDPATLQSIGLNAMKSAAGRRFPDLADRLRP